MVAYGSAIEGTYNCKSDAGTPGSMNAVGTFSAVLTSATGGTTIISNGVFNTPIPVTGS